jgi:hypothetical protein
MSSALIVFDKRSPRCRHDGAPSAYVNVSEASTHPRFRKWLVVSLSTVTLLIIVYR